MAKELEAALAASARGFDSLEQAAKDAGARGQIVRDAALRGALPSWLTRHVEDYLGACRERITSRLRENRKEALREARFGVGDKAARGPGRRGMVSV